MRLTNDEYAAYPHARELIAKMAEECRAVTSAAGIDLSDGGDPVEGLMKTIERFHESGTKPKCSMLQDLERGRLTEIDAINGSIVREGKRLGVPTPVNDVMVALVKLQERRKTASMSAWSVSDTFVSMRIEVIDSVVPLEHLRQIAEGGFGTMVKAVIDVERGIMAVGVSCTPTKRPSFWSRDPNSAIFGESISIPSSRKKSASNLTR